MIRILQEWFKLKRRHQWQQFTECCVVCGFNAYEKGCPDFCPGKGGRRKYMYRKAKQMADLE